jgi:hypothetical protein
MCKALKWLYFKYIFNKELSLKIINKTYKNMILKIYKVIYCKIKNKINIQTYL